MPAAELPLFGDASPAPARPAESCRPTRAAAPPDLSARFTARLARLARRAEQDGWDPEVDCATAPAQVIDEPCRSLLRANDSPDIAFDLSINPYRGCEHGCLYCCVRPVHGPDFETRIFAKTNAADRLREELRRPGYQPRPINIGSATDAYQPAERRLGITRALLEVLDEARHPLGIVTRSGGIVRDLELLAAMAARGQLLVFVSMSTLDARLSRQLEPRASRPARRLAAIRALAQAGVWVGVNVAPVIPRLNEDEIESIIEAAAQAGARAAHWTALQRPAQTGLPLPPWLDEALQDSPEPGLGTWAERIGQRIEAAAARHGLAREVPELDRSAFRPPRPPRPGQAAHFDRRSGQGELF